MILIFSLLVKFGGKDTTFFGIKKRKGTNFTTVPFQSLTKKLNHYTYFQYFRGLYRHTEYFGIWHFSL